MNWFDLSETPANITSPASKSLENWRKDSRFQYTTWTVQDEEELRKVQSSLKLRDNINAWIEWPYTQLALFTIFMIAFTVFIK